MNVQIKRYALGGEEKHSIDFDPGDLAPIETRPSLFLGLGGGGSTAVSNVRKLFVETYRGKRKPGEKEIPSSFQFLAFDSTPNAPEHLTLSQNFFQLSGAGLTPDGCKKIANQPEYKAWTKKDFKDLNPAQGCSGFRNFGRFLLLQPGNIGLVNDQISKSISAARQGLSDNTLPVIYIFCTIAGGTGSGLLLDVCFMLRHQFPDSLSGRLVLMLAVAEGIASDPEMVTRAKLGCYSALREMDTFQSNERRSAWLQAEARRDPSLDPSDPIFAYPGGAVKGRYARLAQEIFLFSPNNQAGEPSLATADAIPAFMARCAFALTAYPVPRGAGGGGGQSFEENLNNRLPNMTDTIHDANKCYLVPGYTSVVMPVEQVFNLLNFEAVTRLIRLLAGGKGDPDQKEEAEQFLLGSFDAATLLRRVDEGVEKEKAADSIPGLRKHPRMNTGDIEALAGYFGKGRLYEQPANSRDLAAPFANLCEGEDRAEVWRKEIVEEFTATDRPSVFTELRACFVAALRRRTKELLLDTDYLAKGAADFLRDLETLLSNSADEQAKAAESARLGWERYRKEIAAPFLRTVRAICKPGGFTDFLEKRKLRESYAGEVEDLYKKLHHWIRATLTRDLLRVLLEDTQQFKAASEQLAEALVASEDMIRQQIKQLESELYRCEQRQGSGLHDLHAVSLLDHAWRKRYTKAARLDHDGALFGMVGASSAPDDTAVRTGWTFLTPWEQSVDGSVPTPLDVGDSLSAHLFERIGSQASQFLKWKSGEGFLNALNYAGVDLDESYRRMRDLIATTNRSQLEISSGEFGVEPGAPITLFAGPPQITQRLYPADVPAPAQLNHALTFESNRIVLFTARPCVALPTCGIVKRLDEEWSRYSRSLRKSASTEHCRDEFQGFHAFCESWVSMQEPVYFWRGDEHSEAFAAALLVGLSCPPAQPVSGCPAVELMAGIAKNYAEPPLKRLGIFRDATGALWLAPNKPEDSGGLTLDNLNRLGADLVTALSAFASNSAAIAEVSGWRDWFQQQSPLIFPQKAALRDSLRLAIAELEKYEEADGDNPVAARRWRKLAEEARRFAEKLLTRRAS